jgi:outer membrane protein assembly factor BamB
MKRILSAILVVLLVLGAGRTNASDPGQSGWATFVGTNPMTLQWNIEIDTILKSSLVNSNGIVTVAISGGFDIICIENSTGQILWKTRSPNQLSGVPEISGTYGLVLSSTRLGEIVGYNIKTGQKEFGVSTGWEETSSPILAERYLIVRGFDQNTKKASVMAISISKGQIVWKTSSVFAKISPCASNGVVYTGDDKFIKAINEEDGVVLWKAVLDAPADFVSARGKLLAVTCGRKLIFFDPATGYRTFIHEFDSAITASPTFSGSFCAILTENSTKLVCLNIETGSTLWSRLSENPYTKPQVWNNGLIVPSTSCIQTIELATGKILWDISFVGQLSASPVAVIDYMIIPTSQKIYAYRNTGFEIQIGVNSLDLGMMTNEEPFGSTMIQVFNYSGAIQHISCNSGDEWLKVSPEKLEIGAHDSAELYLSADMRAVGNGAYSSNVEIIWSQGTKKVAVEARKVRREEEKSPKPGMILADKTMFETSARLGQSNPVFQINLENPGDLAIDYSLSSNSSWLMLTKPEGNLRGKERLCINIGIVTMNALMGKNDGLITIKSKKTNQQLELFVRFWRDPGVMTVISEFEVGSSVARISGVKVRARPDPYMSGKAVMLPLNFIHLMLDCRLEKTGEGSYRFTRGNVSFSISAGSRISEIFTPAGLTRFEMEAPVESKSGMLMIPVSLIVKVFDGQLYKNENRYTLELKLVELE